MSLLARFRARFRRPPAAPPDDPRVTLERAYAEQLTVLQQSRRGLADVATARARLHQQAEDLQRQAAALQEEAEQAVAAGNDALALSALDRQSRISDQRADLLRQHTELAAQEIGLRQAVTTLADQIERLRASTETLAAQYAAADAQAVISGALGSVTEQLTTGLALQAVEDMTLARRAEAAALEDLAAPALPPDTLSAAEALDRIKARQAPAPVADTGAGTEPAKPAHGSGGTPQ